jgi:hypothetical protein
MIKLKIEGEPKDIAKLLAFFEDCDEIDLEWHSQISKRAESNRWGSAIAGIDIDYAIEDEPEIIIRQRKKDKGKKPIAQPGYIYVLPAYGKNGLLGYKIGKSQNPYSRRGSFGIKLNFEIEYLIIIQSNDYSKLEKQLHAKYKDKRRGASEWFNLDEAEIEELKAMMTLEDKTYLATLNQRINPYPNE